MHSRPKRDTSDSHISSPQRRLPSTVQSHPRRFPFLHDLSPIGFKGSDVSDAGNRGPNQFDQPVLPRIESSLPNIPVNHHSANDLQNPNELLSNPRYRDVNSGIKHLRNLHDQPLGDFTISHHEIMSLVEALAPRVKGEAGYTLEHIIVLCHGLLTSDISPDSLVSAFQALTGAVLDELYRNRQIQTLDQAIECLRKALKTSASGLQQVSLNLANLLAARFLTLHLEDDYRLAKAVLDNIAVSRSPRDLSGSYHIQASALITTIGHARSIVKANFEDFEGAVSRCRSFLEHCSLFGDPLHPVITKLLASHMERCTNHLGSLQGAQVVHSNIDPLPLSLRSAPFGDGVDESDAPSLAVVEEKIKRLRQLRATALPGTDFQRKCLNDLVRCYDVKVSLTQDVAAIEVAIKYRRMVLATTHPSDPSTCFHLSSFGNFLYLAFSRTRRVEYLDESITLHREIIGVENARLIHFATTRRLIKSLSIRWRLFGRRNDLDEVMYLFASGAKDTYVTVPCRFVLAYDWAYTARIYGHHSLPAAYENAMSLMQSALVFAPTLRIQHDLLVERHDLYEKTPLNFASHLIRAGQIERAIETLEQGRALLWSEMRGLRTSTDQLRAANPLLAERFTAINHDLEIMTTSASSDGSAGMGDGSPEGDEWMEQLPGLMKRQHELLLERDTVISQIRRQPGFEKFLLPLCFDTLRSAASHGPVIVINHCKWRSDIIIVLRDSPPSLITTPYNFFGRANRLKDELLGTRQRYGPDSDQYVRALISVLKGLYELIGIPVIERLKKLGIPEQSRIWWCPTSVFGYLPLHAMGPIPSAGKEMRYFSDIYISSYTPTLSALITSRNSGARNSNPLNILLVAQPSRSLPGVSGEIKVIQSLKMPVTSLISEYATPSAVLDGLRRHQFCHFACHGELTSGKPFDASLILYKEERLMLLDIVRSRLPTGECAFLATCHTAELSDGSLPDEVLHLSAAIQYSGFRSVIGTMWAMADEDGQHLAKYFYDSMFSDERQRVPHYERSAGALAAAVRRLRGRGARLERWVNYAHFGA